MDDHFDTSGVFMISKFDISEFACTLCMLNLNVIDNGLACDCGVCRVLITIYHRFCKNFIPKNGLYCLVYYIWYIAFIESYYFLCVKKTMKQICRNVSINMQIVCNGSFKCSKYTII